MAPERRDVGPAHRAGDGCGQGACSSPTRRSPGTDALTTAKVLAGGRRQRLGGADLVIAGTESSDGYTGTVPEQIAELLGLPSVTFAKTRRGRRRHAQGQPPDRGRLRRGHLPAARRRQRDRRRRRAPLPELQGHHGRQVEAGRHGHGRRPRRRRRSAGPAPASRSSTSPDAEAREAGEIIEDDGEALHQDRRVPREPESHLRTVDGTSTTSGYSHRPPNGAPTIGARSSCSPRPARSAAPSPRSSAATPRPSPARSASTAPTKVYATGDLGGTLPGRRRRRRR